MLDYLELCTSSFKIVNIHSLLNTVMTPKISKIFALPAHQPSLFQWVVIKHMYTLSMTVLHLQCSCIGYLQKPSEDVQTVTVVSEMHRTFQCVCVVPLHCMKQLRESVFRSFSLFFCEKTRNDLAAQKWEVCSNTCIWEWKLQLHDDDIQKNFTDNHGEILIHASFAFGWKTAVLQILILEKV